MHEPGELPKISEVKSELHDKRLLKLIDKYEPSGWKKVVKDVTKEVVNNPNWLLDGNIFESFEVGFNTDLLNAITKNNYLESLDNLSNYSRDEPAKRAFIMRFIETFSNKYNFPYVWRGGSLDDLDHGVLQGTFTFFTGVAKDYVNRSYDGPRKNPCLFGLPVKAIIDQYKKHQLNFVAEHGYNGIFNTSFDLSIPIIPEGTMIYLPG